jgi:hypothetical protein
MRACTDFFTDVGLFRLSPKNAKDSTRKFAFAAGDNAATMVPQMIR